MKKFATQIYATVLSGRLAQPFDPEMVKRGVREGPRSGIVKGHIFRVHDVVPYLASAAAPKI
jgi:hypothetical protein